MCALFHKFVASLGYLLEFPDSPRCVHRNVLVGSKGQTSFIPDKKKPFIVAAGFIVGQWATPMKYSFLKRAKED
jgi:hypothetical protein